MYERNHFRAAWKLSDYIRKRFAISNTRIRMQFPQAKIYIFKERQFKMKRKIYETGNVSTLQEMKLFFTTIRELFPEIDVFIGSHELVNERICNNECYFVSFGMRKTVLYINMDIA